MVRSAATPRVSNHLASACAIVIPAKRNALALAFRARALDAGAGLRRRARRGGSRARAVAFVIVKAGPEFGAGDRHRRTAPGGEHDQRGSFAQAVVEPRQPVDGVLRGS